MDNVELKPENGKKKASRAEGDQPSFREYGAEVIEERLRKMLSYTRAVRRGDDIEALHDMRVASRRLRAALNIFEAAFPHREFSDFEREVKGVTDALGVARDLDVMLDTLDQLERAVPMSQRGGLESFAEMKRRARQKRQKDIIEAFDRLERVDLCAWFARIAEAAEKRADHAGEKAEEAVCPNPSDGEA